MKKSDFYFDLPKHLIAKYPTKNRGDSKLLVAHKNSGEFEHRTFSDINDYLNPDDLLVMNNSRVIPARLFGQKPTGAKVELLIERILDKQHALAHIKSNRALKPGQRIEISDTDYFIITDKTDRLYHIQLPEGKNLLQLLEIHGHIPLPPYLEREAETEDKTRYQTVYAQHEGSVAAPTAGLHFNKSKLDELQHKGVILDYVTLHVGAGTFLPVSTDNIQDHVMHSEYIEVSQETCKKVTQAKSKKNKVVAVGTTSIRCLETASNEHVIQPYSGETDIFIYPGYQFKTVDALLTNFHLPESSLMMLISALGGHDLIMKAYEEAIKREYRFFSYGDAMLIV